MYHKKAVMAAISYITLCVAIIGVALICNPYYPVRIIAGESSAGTWLSGVLLITVAILCLVLSMQKRLWPWSLFALFFIYLALDERFMYHENLKERLLIMVRDKPSSIQWIGELPVVFGSIAGFLVAVLIYKNIPQKGGKILLGSAVLCGIASVTIDILHCGVFWEDLLKLIAELCLVCAFIGLIPL